MTERKPSGMSFTSWIDQQISDAAERGAFDNLPGAGKPLPRHGDDEQAWLREYLRREGVSAEVLLPAPLRLRKEAARLAEAVAALPSEQEVREAVAELNHRIKEWRRIPVGPPIFVPLVDEDLMLGRWREAQPAKVPDAARAELDAAGQAKSARRATPARPRRWLRLRRRAES
jgi:hypothetical protein